MKRWKVMKLIALAAAGGTVLSSCGGSWWQYIANAFLTGAVDATVTSFFSQFLPLHVVVQA